MYFSDHSASGVDFNTHQAVFVMVVEVPPDVYEVVYRSV